MLRKIYHNYFSRRYLPYWSILFVDALMVLFSGFMAYGMVQGFTHVFEGGMDLKLFLLSLLVSNLIFYRIFHTYSNVLRYSSFVDILRVYAAMFCGYGIVLLVSMFTPDEAFPSVSTLGVAFCINFVLMVGGRVLIKNIYDSILEDKQNSQAVFVYGVKEGGISIAKLIRNNQKEQYILKGFVSDDPSLDGKMLMGVKIYLNDGLLISTMLSKEVNTLIVSPMKMEEFAKNNMAEKFMHHDIKLLTAPAIQEWSKTPGQNRLKEIQIEDLLQREPISINMQEVATDLQGKRIMITGAAGSIGSEIMRQIAQFHPAQLILVDQAETPLHDIRLELHDKWPSMNAITVMVDVSRRKRLEKVFKQYKPEYVFHAAAYKHVPMMEDNVHESIRVNVAGTRNVADLAVQYGVQKFVMISTDKAVNPTNVMGCSKRICEIYVQSLARKLEREGKLTTQFITTRFGNVLGSNGSVIPRFKQQIEKGGPVTVTHKDIIRYFMTIPEACKLVLQAGSMGHSGEIYLFDMGAPVKIYDLAKNMIALSGRKDVKIEITGLRDGEKLYEELLNVKEHTKPTYHEKIMISNVREYDYDEANAQIAELIDYSKNEGEMVVVGKMKEIVPEFISKHSRFEELDKKRA